MTVHRYKDAVIGSVADLTFTVRLLSTKQLVDLEDESAAATCKIVDVLGNVIVAAGACTFLAKEGKYRWNTAGMSPGVYRVQFALSDGIDPVPIIEPAEPAEITLIAPL